MRRYNDDNSHNHYNDKNKKHIVYVSVAIALLLVYVVIITDSVIFKIRITNAIALLANQSIATKNNSTQEKVVKPSLTLGNITKLTTTQGNVTTNANAASSFPIKEANATKVFPPNNKVAIVLGAALKRDKAYQPNPVSVKAGGAVVWTNEDTVAHTVTSGSGFNDQTLGREFDSGFLGKGFSHIFFKPGVFPYFCEIHPTMVGKVIVK
ncbi:MAG: plastocyanin/azurin family copper-binding protein [Nitrososphaeraceae archaeon]